MPNHGDLLRHEPDEEHRKNFLDRLKEDPAREDASWWKYLMEFILKSDFLLGKKGFKASFEWIIKEKTTLLKVIKGEYHDPGPERWVRQEEEVISDA